MISQTFRCYLFYEGQETTLVRAWLPLGWEEPAVLRDFPLQYSARLIEARWNGAWRWQKYNHEINSTYGQTFDNFMAKFSEERAGWMGRCQNDKNHVKTTSGILVQAADKQFLISNTRWNNRHQSPCLIRLDTNTEPDVSEPLHLTQLRGVSGFIWEIYQYLTRLYLMNWRIHRQDEVIT